MISELYRARFYPDSGLNIVWHSDFIDSTYNTAGVRDEAVDYLIEGIMKNQEDSDALLAWGRALDRVLTWNHYGIPEWHISAFRVAYWNKFGKPKIRPKYEFGVSTWWIDPVKERKLPDNVRR